MSRLELPVLLFPDDDGGFVAECPVIPGCISQGDTREEALANIKDAIELSLANRTAEGWPWPESARAVEGQVERVRVAVGDPLDDQAALHAAIAEAEAELDAG